VKIRYMDEFKEGYLRIVSLLNNPLRFYGNLKEVVQLLEQGYKKPPNYIVNPIKGYRGFYNCYLYQTTQHIIILQYRIGGGYADLLRIDTIENFIDLN
jgi:hypothetical protein